MKFGVVVFPGSNCDDDMVHAFQHVMGCETVKIWHKDTALPSSFTTEDCIILPGGFSYGDYVRSGAIAKLSPIMRAVTAFANKGGYVWGICNGFQILCEAGLLPGVLLPNAGQKFICKNWHLKTVTTESRLTQFLDTEKALKIPIAHADGRFYADDATLKSIEKNKQVLFRYCDENGKITKAANPNGSLKNIAGICNKARNVFGMMPHPERGAEEILGNSDGYGILASLVGAEVSACV